MVQPYLFRLLNLQGAIKPLYRDFQNPCNTIFDLITEELPYIYMYGRFRADKLPYKEVTEF